MSKKLGFIGCGNMGKAMIHGVLASGKAQASDILASAKTESSREKNAAELGIRLTADNKSVAEFADILFLAVKPQYYEKSRPVNCYYADISAVSDYLQGLSADSEK